MAQIAKHFALHAQPVADPAAVVRAPGARFTVLTSRLIRMEYSPTEEFEDRASQTFWYRKQPLPSFTVARSGDMLEIETDHLLLRYRATPAGFTSKTLSVEVKETGRVWHFGDSDPDNLLGTARTLDKANGRVRLAQGLISTSGWAVVDDSKSLVFNSDSWLEQRVGQSLDLYFFGYGHHYQDCLRDFCKVAGQVPMIPRWILGNWWSRYWAYTQDELKHLVEEFEQHEIPLSVCIIDMDWHITETGNASTGWTGYTWNKKLWPDPYGFIAWLHSKGLRTAMNLHPAEGIWPHEEQYAQMAEAMGIDPASGQPVPFDIADPTFTEAYFRILHHPMEARGVDFWWMDWQQGTLSKLPGLDPLWWLNHLHFLDRGRDGSKRPFVFSRWGGLSNHRYPIGFSGDTIISWESLAFQPYFTATAANVQFGWWSHDIGGHMWGFEDPELYTRWVQFGVFSPILRLHSTNNPYHDRRPWVHGEDVLRITRDAMQLRHALIPYLYSMAWRNHTESIPLIVPMYHVYPESPQAYCCPNQYCFGSELVVAPYVQKANPETRLSRQVIWLPDGDWFDFFSGEHYQGGRWRAVYGRLQDIPVFAKAGAIVPLAPKVSWGGIDNPAELDVHIFPGADGQFTLYEDDGDSTAYLQGAYCLTTFVQSWHDDTLRFTIEPTNGDTTLTPARRHYRLLFRGVSEADASVEVNGMPVPFDKTYDHDTETLVCSTIAIMPHDTLVVTLKAHSASLLSRRDRTAETVRRMLHLFHLESRAKWGIDRNLPAIMADVSRLADYWMDLKDSQATALVEVIRKTALDREVV